MSKRKRGKIIEKWKFTVNKIKVVVPVRMDTPEYADQKAWFIVDFEYGEHRFHKTMEDINALRLATRAWLRDVVTFEYESFFYVTFSGSGEKPQHHEKERQGFSDQAIKDMNDSETGEVYTKMEWRKFHSGTTAGGKTIYRDCSRLLNNGDWIEGDLEAGLEKRDFCEDGRDSMKALIPATPENEAGLLKLADAFQDLHNHMMAFLSPEQIERNFTRMIGNMPKLLEKP